MADKRQTILLLCKQLKKTRTTATPLSFRRGSLGVGGGRGGGEVDDAEAG